MHVPTCLSPGPGTRSGTRSSRFLATLVALVPLLAPGPSARADQPAALSPAPVAGSVTAVLDRIVPGWTNYSTAFNATHDTAEIGDFATVAGWIPPQDTGSVAAGFSVIVVGDGSRAPDFSRFSYRIMVWDSLNAFRGEPRTGNVHNWTFATPTGGSTTTPDTFTRGGRPAFRLSFDLATLPCTFSNNPVLIGFAAQADTRQADSLFVPTSAHPGDSDLQAGDLVPGGFREILQAGGSTVYSGQLALAVSVLRPGPPGPRLAITASPGQIRLSWPASAQEAGYIPEWTLSLAPDAPWFPLDADPFEENGDWHVVVRPTSGQQWFRLRR